MIRGVKHKARGPELAQQRPGGSGCVCVYVCMYIYISIYIDISI